MAAFGLDKLFGFFFARDEQKVPEPISFAPREADDGAATITATGAMGVYIDLDGSIRSEVELINRYRTMEQVSTVDLAVDEIVNEVIVGDEGNGVQIVLDDIDQPENVKTAIEEAFDEVIDLLDFKSNGYQLFKRWYVDGRLYFHTIIDESDRKKGIEELRYIDPRKIRKIREVVKRQVKNGTQSTSADAVVQQTRNEYYVYSDKGFNLGTARPLTTAYPITGLKIAKDSIVHVTSGLSDAAGTMTLSQLHKAIKPLNMFTTLKDAAVIHRLVRAPERRVWSVYVGNLPRMKAEQYLKSVMDKYRTKLNYDVVSGEIRDDRRFQTMLEDYWLPTNAEGKGTTVDTLPPAANYSMEDVQYFEKELYLALNVPVGRIANDQDTFAPPISTEITRDEIKFGKFIARLRRRFNKLFVSCLEKQLVLKEVMTIEDFAKIKKKIDFQYSKDNYFEEAKENQVYTMRGTLAGVLAPYVGRWFSDEWIRKNVWKQTDEEIEEIDQQIAQESLNPQYQGVPGQAMMDDGSGSEDGDAGQAGAVIDTNAVPEPPTDPNAASKTDKAKEKGGARGKSKSSFKTVAKYLSKNK